MLSKQEKQEDHAGQPEDTYDKSIDKVYRNGDTEDITEKVYDQKPDKAKEGVEQHLENKTDRLTQYLDKQEYGSCNDENG